MPCGRAFGLVIEREPDLTATFYEELFARHPEARPVFFRKPLQVQERMLAETLVAALAHLEDPAWLGEKLADLGAGTPNTGWSTRCTAGWPRRS